MMTGTPYVVLVTSPSAGVGKSTLASNLAVYLKALAEDLPVAYAALDAGAPVDAMFQLAAPPTHSLLELAARPFRELFCVGQFGVDYCAPTSPAARPVSAQALRKGLAKADYPGLLILDSAADNPHFSLALAVADLVLLPVKDPAVLPEVVRLQQALLASGGEREQLWLLPSQLGAESSYRQRDALAEFLRFAAEERGFQVLNEQFLSDDQAAEQAVNLSKSVLTRAPQSDLHLQLAQIARLLLEQHQSQNSFAVRIRRAVADGLLPARSKRVEMRCCLCAQPVDSAEVHYLEGFPSRRRLLLHRECVANLLRGTSAAAFQGKAGLTLVQSATPFGGRPTQLRLQVLSAELELLNTETLEAAADQAWLGLVQAATGRCLAEIYREGFLYSEAVAASKVFSADWYRAFLTQRRGLRQACRTEQL